MEFRQLVLSLASQDSIFFMAADSRSAAEAAPFVERLTKLGYEVLYLTEPIDEYVVMTLGQFEEKKFVDVTREGLKLPEEEGEGRGSRHGEVATRRAAAMMWRASVVQAWGPESVPESGQVG